MTNAFFTDIAIFDNQNKIIGRFDGLAGSSETLSNDSATIVSHITLDELVDGHAIAYDMNGEAMATFPCLAALNLKGVINKEEFMKICEAFYDSSGKITFNMLIGKG